MFMNFLAFYSCVQIQHWFDYRNHICIVSTPMKFVLFLSVDFVACVKKIMLLVLLYSLRSILRMLFTS